MIKKLFCKGGWAPIAVVVAHGIAGEIFGHEPYVDPIIHFLGGGAIAYFFLQTLIIFQDKLGAPSRCVLMLAALSLAFNAALFWEFGEFLVDRCLDRNMQRDLMNTMRDLFNGSAGALLVIGSLASTKMIARKKK